MKIFTILKITQILNFVNRCELNFTKYSIFIFQKSTKCSIC
nr:MAG TPA: hypothetical protein [Caudoviricetes sp.]